MSQKKTFFIMEGAMIAAVYVALTLAFAHRKTVFKTGY